MSDLSYKPDKADVMRVQCCSQHLLTITCLRAVFAGGRIAAYS